MKDKLTRSSSSISKGKTQIKKIIEKDEYLKIEINKERDINRLYKSKSLNNLHESRNFPKGIEIF